jgi:hypothetical protein
MLRARYMVNTVILFGVLMLSALISGCGGGGGDSTPNTPSSSSNISQQLAKTTSANTTVVPNDASAALSSSLRLSQKIVASVQASQTFNCAGGGTASYTVTGAAPGLWINGVLDAGENYTLTFRDCKDNTLDPNASALNGSWGFTVVKATATAVTIDTVTSNLSVSNSHGSVTFAGSSRLEQTIVVNGAITVVTSHWTSPLFSVTTNYNSRTSVFTLKNIDITTTQTYTNGVSTGSTYSGTSTLSANVPNGFFDITTATQTTVTYDVNGNATQGTWIITLPNNRITLAIAGNTATLSVDYGADGTIDLTLIFTVTELEIEAG